MKLWKDEGEKFRWVMCMICSSRLVRFPAGWMEGRWSTNQLWSNPTNCSVQEVRPVPTSWAAVSSPLSDPSEHVQEYICEKVSFSSQSGFTPSPLQVHRVTANPGVTTAHSVREQTVVGDIFRAHIATGTQTPSPCVCVCFKVDSPLTVVFLTNEGALTFSGG